MASTWGDFQLLAVTADAIYLCYSSMAGNLHTAPKCGFTRLQTFLSSIYIHHGLLQLFISAHSGTVCINLGDVGAMAYSHSGQPLLTPRAFGVVEDIFCIFEGILDNVAVLRQRYGLNKSADEVAIIIEAYRTLRDRGPYCADEVIRDLLGKFAFVLYDSTSEALFTAADVDDSVPFFWGTAADDYLVLSDEPNVLKEGCGKSFAPFPRGCYFPTSGGLQSFEHPLNKLMPMPRV